MSTGQEACTLKGHVDEVTCVAFSKDAKRIAAGSHETKVWQASDRIRP